MKLTAGNNLSLMARNAVLAAFTYRLTTENGYPRRNPCNATVPAITDTQWLAEHAFWITKSGKLARNRRHAEPAYMADTDEGSK